ncbi:type II toxin-antitoxin system Phd/YefM family antitoxin [Xylanimonas sp. McL0601]|uniref:type II toxin-antitoxin system Phd/YefM family antitoxin n=1 Tax=Xylanimonas sp. McL0601 TaxID=3414739 RepID=UPI003CED8088
MSALTISEARASLPSLVDRVAQGEEITITRHGKPVAVMVRPDVLRARRSSAVFERADRIGRLLEEARHRPVRKGGLTTERAEEIVAWVREGRDAWS